MHLDERGGRTGNVEVNLLIAARGQLGMKRRRRTRGVQPSDWADGSRETAPIAVRARLAVAEP